jgi:hypothetical protein
VLLLLLFSSIHSGYSVTQVTTLVSTGCKRTARTADEPPVSFSFLHRFTSDGLKLSRATDAAAVLVVSDREAATLPQWTCRCVAYGAFGTVILGAGRW